MKRKRDLEMAAEYREKPCLCCGVAQGVSGHHLKSFKSGGLCSYQNLVPLCQVHHFSVHNKGLKFMAIKFPLLRKHLDDTGWEFSHFQDKWIYYGK